jgi:hypothetical protein
MFGFSEIFGTLHVHPLGKPFLNSVAFSRSSVRFIYNNFFFSGKSWIVSRV